MTLWRGGRGLVLGQTVNVVVQQQHGHIGVVTNRVDPVRGTDRGAITVAHHHKNVQLRTRQLETRRNRQGSAMNTMEAVRVDIVREATGAANSGDKGHLLRFQLFFCQQTFYRVQGTEVTATGTPLAFTCLIVFCHEA